MGNRPGWNTMVLAMLMVAGCETTTIQRPGGGRILTGFEMDQVTAGSAAVANDAAARAVGSAPQTTAAGTASAYSGHSPIAGIPFLNYASSQTMASAKNGEFAQASLSTRVSVESANGGASIDATAAGTAAGGGTSHPQVTTQFYGVSTNRADIVFGSVDAVACCGPFVGAQVDVDSGAGGPYWRELRGAPVSDIPGQVQSRVDIAIASSALPILDPAQVLVARAPPRMSPKY